MGTRINYDVVGDGGTCCFLFTDNSHPEVDPEAEFRRLVGATDDATALVEACLGLRYETNGGDHKSGDRIFLINLTPDDDRELVYRVGWFDGKPNVMKSSDFPPPPPMKERLEMATNAALSIQSQGYSNSDTDETVESIVAMIKNGHLLFSPPSQFVLTSLGFALNISLT